MIRTQIIEGWRVTEAAPVDFPLHRALPWLNATVPGHVHLDLQNAGVIPEPFYRFHERDVTWVDETDWVYETEFDTPADVDENTFLIFEGLDTVAEIRLNGELLGVTDNMHFAHEFLVGPKLHRGTERPGRNTLTVTFRSARRVGRERQDAWAASGNDTLPRHWDWWSERSFVRKAQYMYGWDWGPSLVSCGIWKPVKLVQAPTGRILDYRYATTFHDDGRATVEIEAFVERAPRAINDDLNLIASLAGTVVIGPVPKRAGRVPVLARIDVDNAEHWQPNGSGIPYLYDLQLTLRWKAVVDSVESRIGLRTIELVREPDTAPESGESFKFRVNGVDTFIKGANWIPSYSFPSIERIGDQLRAARDAGFNMLRVWGGGLYESDAFYDECDRLGIMVWQDFGYACAYYPDRGKYLADAKSEATAVVRLLRRHPSLALWCGNNENDTMHHDDWGGFKSPRFLGEDIYHKVLPAVVSEEDPARPYWPSSPYGGSAPNSDDCGDQHNWDVWHGRGDWVHYAENRSRFASEFGFASSCGLAAWNSCLAEQDRSAFSAVVRWHDKTRKGYDTYIGFVARHFRVPETLEDLVYYSQINQAEALKFGVEHYRRLKGRCWGTLFWQLNDCWPTQSWSIIDSAGEPKAAYYACRRFYAPLLLSLVRNGDVVEAHLVNDTAQAVEGVLTLSVESLHGGVLAQVSMPVCIGPNTASAVGTIAVGQIVRDDLRCYAFGELKLSENVGIQGAPVENLLVLCEPNELPMADGNIDVKIEDFDEANLAVTVEASQFAPYVWLFLRDGAELRVSDNFFHVRARKPACVLVKKTPSISTPGDLRRQLRIMTLTAPQTGPARGEDIVL